MTAPVSTRDIRHSIRIAAPAERVWSAFADPKHLTGWFADHVEGQLEPGATVYWIFRDFNARLPMRVIDLSPGVRVTFDITPDGAPRQSHQSFHFDREGEETAVRVIHTGFGLTREWDDIYEGVVSGWHMAFATLKQYVENYYGQPRTSITMMRPGVFEYQDVVRLYRGRGVERWLAPSGSIAAEGEPYAIDLGPAIRMAGRVLCLTPREAMLGWDAEHAVLELKAFSLKPPDRVLCLRISGWGQVPGRLAELQRILNPAFDRLAKIVLSGSRQVSQSA